MKTFAITVLATVSLFHAEAARAALPSSQPMRWSWEATPDFAQPNLKSYTLRLGGINVFGDLRLLDERKQPLTVSQSTTFGFVWDEDNTNGHRDTDPNIVAH